MKMPNRKMKIWRRYWSLGEERGLETDIKELFLQMEQLKRKERIKFWWMVEKGRKPEYSLPYREEGMRKANRGGTQSWM